MPRASVVITFHQQPADLGRCLQALAREGLDDVEVVLVNNGSRDARTPALLEAWADRATVLRNPVDAGPVAARNQGARAARSPVVVWVDPRAEVRPGWLAPLVAAAAPGAGAAGGVLLAPDGRVRHAGMAMVGRGRLDRPPPRRPRRPPGGAQPRPSGFCPVRSWRSPARRCWTWAAWTSRSPAAPPRRPTCACGCGTRAARTPSWPRASRSSTATTRRRSRTTRRRSGAAGTPRRPTATRCWPRTASPTTAGRTACGRAPSWTTRPRPPRAARPSAR